MYLRNDIRRLLEYRLCLLKFKELGFEKVYSYYLAHEAGVSPEQVRKDFSKFAIKGNKKAGYNINNLLEILDNIFQKYNEQNIILIGMGNIGKALTNYTGFIKNKINIIAAFDIDPSKQKKSYIIPVYPMERIAETINKNNINIAVITVPQVAAQEVCNKLVQAGIKGIINFSPTILKVPDDVFVNNINLSLEFDTLIYYLK